ncbi:MAG: GNAT family N-acetyltransferase [Eubacterium sp.]|nr:GNAT family N-acetyltransferase [Eubacterium sp.]
MLTIRKDDCYIGISDGKVTAIVIVEKPSDKPEIVVKSIPEPRWHLYFLAVDPKDQKRGIGSEAIQGFLIPLVKSNGGNLITVTTNSEKNVDFYINNGFTLVKEEMLECNEKSIGNWMFRMDL